MGSKTTKAPKKTAEHTADRSRWGQEAVLEVYPQIQAFVISRVGWPAGEDVSQKVLEGIVEGLDGVSARTQSQFRAWCFRIARNKINDGLRSKYGDIFQPLGPEELISIIEAGAEGEESGTGLQSDLEYVLQLLRASKYPCDEMLKERYILGLKDIEIGALYGIDKEAARMRVNRCLETAQMLAKRLS